MITKMKKYTFLIMSSAYEQFLLTLREAGVVHVTQKANGLADNAELQATVDRADEIRRLLKQGATDQLLRDKAEVEARLVALRKEAERVALWGNFSSEKIEQLREAGYDLHFYTCPESKFLEEWGIVVAQQNGSVYFATVDALPENVECCQPVVLNKSAQELEKDIESVNALLVAANARIEAWQLANMDALAKELQETEQSIDFQRVSLSGDTAAEGALTLLEGFCPADQCEALNATLSQTSCYYEAEDPSKEDKTPIKLRNNWFTRMFECLTGMYGMPNYGEFDPTPILGPFFLLFFALCIGDAGYGLLLILVGYLIYKGKLKIEMFDGLGGIIMALGVGSTVIGYMMGGFFGVDLWVASWMPQGAKAIMFKTLFGNESGMIPVSAMGQDFDVMMILALVIGVVHICLAMTIKCICSTQRFGFKETISAWGWLVLIVGGLIVLILSGIGVFGPQATSILLIAIAAVSALGIFIFNTPGRNPLINIGAGLWDTYGMATGILGDVLSYIRLYALGLAGGMLGMAFNNLGTMVLGETPNVWRWIGFILIVTFGHVLNLLMACLGAFVHPLRLTFVEYFKNAGYEGSGKRYSPFKK
ncbi:MAG: ATPase V [Bacteroidales bacterium]|nr:ATPase V [Candidatus Colicola coprequi]